MARRRLHVLAACAVLAAGGTILAQEPAATVNGGEPPATPKIHGSPEGKRRGSRAAANSPEFDNVRKAIEALTPEQQKRFQENFVRRMNLAHE